MAKDTLARDSLASVTLAGDTLANDTLASDTLARVKLWPVFLASFGVLGYQRVNKNFMWGTNGKNLKKIIITF